MEKSTVEINKESIDVYNEIVNTMEKMQVDYCQSWWLNYRNTSLGLKTPKINQIAKKLVKQGYLMIDKSRTSTSTGTSYKLTDKKPTWL